MSLHQPRRYPRDAASPIPHPARLETRVRMLDGVQPELDILELEQDPQAEHGSREGLKGQ